MLRCIWQADSRRQLVHISDIMHNIETESQSHTPPNLEHWSRLDYDLKNITLSISKKQKEIVNWMTAAEQQQ